MLFRVLVVLRSIKYLCTMAEEFTQETWPKDRYPNFGFSEFCCTHTGKCVMDEGLLEKLQQIRWALGSPLTVTSGYRDPSHPIEAAKIAAGGPGGAHTTGKAVDIACDREFAFQVLSAAIKAGFTGIGIKQSGSGRFLHLDTIGPEDNFHVPRPTIWSY